MNATATKTPKCCQQVNTGNWCQESYETASRDAAIRAKQLRTAGYQVAVSAIGMQVTPLGLLRMTMVDIRPGSNQDTFCLPEVELVEWPR